MKDTPSQRLINLVPKTDPPQLGISLEDIAKIQVNDRVISDILSCLYDTNVSELGWGLWFCEGLVSAGKLDNQIKTALVQQIPSFIKSEDEQIRSRVMLLVVKLRRDFPEYRSWMLNCLADHSSSVRQDALLNALTFLKPKEIEPLLRFQDDDYLTETSMGSPLVYILRNEALALIEKQIGKTFKKTRLSGVWPEGGQTTYWNDWEPFLEWRKKQKRKCFFGL